MKASAVEQINGGSPGLASVVVIADSAEWHRRISAVLADHGLRQSARVNSPAEAVELDLDASTIIAFLCDIDVPRDLASLRRLRREAREPAVVAISPPSTGTGVRRALDAGADALVFAPELDLTLATTISAVAVGQSVVPRNLRASVETPVLSHRERQVLDLVREGNTNAQIAEALFLAESTIKSHLSSIFTKFGVRSRKEAVAVSVDLEPATPSLQPTANPRQTQEGAPA
jgi:DNA-binding NarL/FixJ family response regulator